MFPIRRQMNRIAANHQTGVSMIRSFGVTETTTDVTIKVYQGSLASLPHVRGLVTLTVDNLPTITGASLPVTIADGIMTKQPLLADGTVMTAADFTNGEHILFCYNRQDGTLRVVSSEALPTAAASAEGAGDEGAGA